VHGVFVQWWQNAANQVAAAGGLPGLQTFELDDVRDCVTGLSASTLARMWFASHSYASNHPPDYPYPLGHTALEGDPCQLMFLQHADFCYQVLGRYIPVIVTEGGYVIDQMEDNTYPRIDETLHAKYTKAIYEQFKTGKLAWPALALPDCVFAYCHFCWRDADYMAFALYLGMNGTLQKTIDAVKSLLSFTRKFSWDAPAPAATLEATAINEAIARKPWMPLNNNASLYKYGESQKLGFPQTDEYEYTFGGKTFVGQVWNLGIIGCEKGQWDKCFKVAKPEGV
jgi:hypothetical protein